MDAHARMAGCGLGRIIFREGGEMAIQSCGRPKMDWTLPNWGGLHHLWRWQVHQILERNMRPLFFIMDSV